MFELFANEVAYLNHEISKPVIESEPLLLKGVFQVSSFQIHSLHFYEIQ